MKNEQRGEETDFLLIQFRKIFFNDPMYLFIKAYKLASFSLSSFWKY